LPGKTRGENTAPWLEVLVTDRCTPLPWQIRWDSVLASRAAARRTSRAMQAVLDYLQANQTRFVRELIDYVRFPSVSAQPQHRKDMVACAAWLLRHCRQIGLDARLVPTAGNPVLLARTPRRRGAKRPHYVVYGHYDVQPPEPFELWKTPPFQPTIRGRSLFGRGASDNKGQNFAHLKAVEAYLKTGTELPCDLTFVIEGEEEVGSAHLATFLRRHRAGLKCEAVVISDTGMPARECPALTYGLRGIVALEVKLTGPARDLHSGLFGGMVDNPAMALCQLLGRLRDARGRVAVPGFYDGVKPLSPMERRFMRKFPINDEGFRRLTGVPKLFGEAGYTAEEQRTARPTLEINGLTAGYQGEGSKTVIGSWARAKLTCRLVPDQNPARVLARVTKQLKRLCPPTQRIEVTPGHVGEPYLLAPEGRLVAASLRALRSAFGREPILMREGGSIPIVTDFQRILGADSLLLGLALPDDNPHSPNEKFDLDIFARGIRMGAHLWQELGR
jgi:acetylornithine deacetylase/succinyl-diaminopimelate desuccinylase-like protein